MRPLAHRAAGPHSDASGPPAGALWRSWTGWATAGEFAGFAVPAAVGALLANAAPGVMFLGLLTAGAMEGAVLGWAQARVLTRAVPGLDGRRWVLATSGAAALAWAIGLVPVALGERLPRIPLPVLVGGAAVAGTVLLASIGTAQWLVLRRHVPRAARWIVTTAGAWALGLAAFTAITTPLWQPGQPVVVVAAVGLLGGLVMAATVAALTGWALVRLLTPRART